MHGLTEAEQKLWDSVGSQNATVFLGRPSLSEVPHGAHWGDEREVRASLIVDILTSDPSRRRGLALVGAHIVGELDLSSMTVPMPLFLRRCYFDGDVTLADAETRRVDLDGSFLCGQLVATGLRAADSILVTNAWCLEGAWVLGAELKGSLSFSGSMLGSDQAGDAVVADHLTARDFLMNNSDCYGTVRLSSARLSGAASLNGAHIRGSREAAVLADSVVVSGSFHCQGHRAYGRDFTTGGRVNLLGARVDGSINFAGATVNVESGDSTALLADRIRAHGGLRLRNGFTASGTVSLLGAVVDGQIDCGDARLYGSPAFAADGAVVTEDVLMNRGMVATDAIRCNGMDVKKQLSFESAKLDPDTCAVDLGGASADALLTNWETAPAAVNLGSATVGKYLDFPETWPAPGRLVLNDFTYKQLTQPATVEHRLDWLARNYFGYVPQTYDVLAAAYRSAGNDEAATEVLIGKQRVRREHPGWSTTPARWWSTFLRWTVGYGYAPARIIPWFVGMVVLGGLLFAGPAGELMVPTNDVAKTQELHPFLYALDLLLPVASLGVRSGWTPIGAAQWLVVGLTLIGWLLGLTLVAAISGALKRG